MKKKTTNADLLIGTRVKAIRLLHGRTQTWLADALGVSFQQVQKYENGTNRVSVATLLLIADAFRMPVNAFLPGKHRRCRRG